MVVDQRAEASRVVSLDRVDLLVTNAAPPAELEGRLTELGVKIIVAE